MDSIKQIISFHERSSPAWHPYSRKLMGNQNGWKACQRKLGKIMEKRICWQDHLGKEKRLWSWSRIFVKVRVILERTQIYSYSYALKSVITPKMGGKAESCLLVIYLLLFLEMLLCWFGVVNKMAIKCISFALGEEARRGSILGYFLTPLTLFNKA